MIPELIIIIAAAAVFILYILSIRPNRGRRDLLKNYEKTPVAHRGLFDNKTVPENSLPAFQKAAELGFPVELDVQITRDEKLVVFHDAGLGRMCGDRRRVTDLSYQELSGLRLLDTDEKIPLFREVLDVIGGRVPIVMEIKPEGDCIRTAALSSAMIREYKGEVCLESFHPFVLKWYKENHPEIARGLLSTDYFKIRNRLSAAKRFVLTNMMLNFIAKPDFISYNHRFSNQPSYRLCRALYKPVNAAWTIRNRQQMEKAAEVFSIIIFDSFIPEKEELCHPK